MPLASVMAAGRGETDRLLADVAADLAGQGARLLGAVRAPAGAAGPGACDCALRLLPEGAVVALTQDLGPGSAACRLDSAALEAAVGDVTARLLGEGCDLVVINKFGLSEAEGRGFRSLIVAALGRGTPVLIGLSDKHRAAFEAFADGLAAALPPEPGAVADWCRAAMAATGRGAPAPAAAMEDDR